MIPEIGHIALITAFAVTLLQMTLPLAGIHCHYRSWALSARPLVYLQSICVTLAFSLLVYSFVVNDFSVQYVMQHSNTRLPLFYRIAATWGAHEGSLLLWALMLSLWTVAVTWGSRSLPEAYVARSIAVLGFISAGFLLFMLCTSNPFQRLWPIPADGLELNPQLQDPGLVFHPPMLYMGYVGLSVPFAFAVATLMNPHVDSLWLRWLRPWTVAAWAFLTFGIVLGSWWAYYELGWGGWWFWDPVENASFIPWLVALALIHSLAASEKRQLFKSWTILLAIFGFSLSLLGTFLVRSGILSSVHAFAADPSRGVFILIFLCLVIGGALALYSYRAPKLMGQQPFSFFSREMMLLLGNITIAITAASVLLGTLYPLIIEAIDGTKLSVGAPYFNAVFVPLTILVLFLLGLGPQLRWKHDHWNRISKDYIAPTLLPLLATAWAIWKGWNNWVVIGIILATWVASTTLWNLIRIIQRSGIKQTLSYWGMVIAHLGVAVAVAGITFTSQWSEKTALHLPIGERQNSKNYQAELIRMDDVEGANYAAKQGTVRIYKDDNEIATLHPEKRFYYAGKKIMTEAAIDAGFWRDIYVVLGEPYDDGSWSLELHVKPFVRWIWLGGLMMMAGGFCAAADKRYRRWLHHLGRKA